MYRRRRQIGASGIYSSCWTFTVVCRYLLKSNALKCILFWLLRNSTNNGNLNYFHNYSSTLRARSVKSELPFNRLSMTCVRRSGSPGLAHFFLTSTRWLPIYENQNPATISRQKCYQIYFWPFQTSKMNFLPNDPFFYRSVPKVAYWWVEQHITRSVSVPQPLQSYRMMMGYQCMN